MGTTALVQGFQTLMIWQHYNPDPLQSKGVSLECGLKPFWLSLIFQKLFCKSRSWISLLNLCSCDLTWKHFQYFVKAFKRQQNGFFKKQNTSISVIIFLWDLTSYHSKLQDASIPTKCKSILPLLFKWMGFSFSNCLCGRHYWRSLILL